MFVGRSPLETHQVVDYESECAAEFHIPEQQPVLVFVFLGVTSPQEVGLLFQFDLVGLWVVVPSRGISSDVDSHSADIFFVISTIIDHLVAYGNLDSAWHFGHLSNCLADTAFRGKDAYERRLFFVDSCNLHEGHAKVEDFLSALGSGWEDCICNQAKADKHLYDNIFLISLQWWEFHDK